MYQLPVKSCVAAFDIDAQQTFTPLCPGELPVAEGHLIAPELNAQARFASLRVASRDAHTLAAVWLADKVHPVYSPVEGYKDCDIRWPAHAIVGTAGFDFIPGLQSADYAYQVYKGIEPTMHPYGACYHDLAGTLSTGVIEFLRNKNISTVICGGLATDYCVKTTVLQLLEAHFTVVVNLGACRGISADTTQTAICEMREAGAIIVANSCELTQE